MSSPARIVVAEDLEGGEGGKNEKNYGGALQSPGAVAVVPIHAPSDLPENYTFDAVHDGVVFPVTVPEGGVKAGQTFMVPFVPTDNVVPVYAVVAEEVVATEVTPLTERISPASGGGGGHPTSTVVTTATVWQSNGTVYGRWKDGLCDCCSFGCCHPSLLNAMCFPQLLMGQVLTRMKMTWCGNPARGQEYKRTFHTLFILSVTYWVIWFFFHCPDGECHRGKQRHKNVVMQVTDVVWGVYTLIVMVKLRKSIRQKYKIPETRCHGCEDCCCVIFCGCCTVSQMARQTADYNQRRALCCSDTGLPEEIPIETTLIV